MDRQEILRRLIELLKERLEEGEWTPLRAPSCSGFRGCLDDDG